GFPGITVQLQDSSGNVLATTKTDLGGHYSFNQLSGPAANPDNASGVSATGDYQIVLLLPSTLHQTTPSPSTILISRGGLDVTGVNFGVNLNSCSSSAAAVATTSAATVQPMATASATPAPTSNNTGTPITGAPTGPTTVQSGSATTLSGGSGAT